LAIQATTRRVVRKSPPRRPQRWRRAQRRARLSLRTKAIVLGLGMVAVLLTWAIFARAFAPAGNTTRTRFDAIIVLGSPADAEGNPTPEQLARVTEAVREYERGVAPRLIVTGGQTRNGFVEAQVMARSAEALGVPSSLIVQEPNARTTIENVCYSGRIMKAHGWRSAEVVSAATHLPRAGIILSRTGLEWRTHAAPSLEQDSGPSSALEILQTIRYLVYAQWADRCA
jgi:uncharacterized SAM-binding protein YcdF (DUF218 family)